MVTISKNEVHKAKHNQAHMHPEVEANKPSFIVRNKKDDNIALNDYPFLVVGESVFDGDYGFMSTYHYYYCSSFEMAKKQSSPILKITLKSLLKILILSQLLPYIVVLHIVNTMIIPISAISRIDINKQRKTNQAYKDMSDRGLQTQFRQVSYNCRLYILKHIPLGYLISQK